MMRSSAGARSLPYERIGGGESGHVGNLTDEPPKAWPEPLHVQRTDACGTSIMDTRHAAQANEDRTLHEPD